MSKHAIQVGAAILHSPTEQTHGAFVTRDGTEYYKIANYDRLAPFFISVVSDSDHWLYISSKGGLTAGRKNPENALFPYYTDDKIHDSGELTGSKTVLRVEKDGTTYLWEPFSDRYAGAYRTVRNLYKNVCGNQLIFEEENHDLGLIFSYGWYSSEQYGFVKKSRLYVSGDHTVNVRVLDGLQNLLPYGVNLKMQTERSTLLDAYKKNELLEASGLGLFLLSSIPVDKAEPSEALRATTVWSTGLQVDTHLLSVRQLDRFRKGEALQSENDVRAERGAYLIEAALTLASQARHDWCLVAEINQGPAAVVELADWIERGDGLLEQVEENIAAGTQNLIDIVGAADGLQVTGDRLQTARHFGNVLFNVMRGGIFDDHYQVESTDLRAFMTHHNRAVAERHADFLNGLSAKVHYAELLTAAAARNDAQLHRLCLEYLPLTFSRRHGDPSRPWNRFSIELREADGRKKLYYEGNWRDIFQNWEALGLSYPLFLQSMIAKFVNASTADGYNPYRVTRNGIDWEVIEEDDPWSYIGYWGDHQIIYLLKLLELSRDHFPGALAGMLSQPLFAYANVPYRIRDYEQLLADPQDTVDFDHALEAAIGDRVARRGADGKLIWNQEGKVLLVNLAEKLLVTLLTKLSNFIPEGGIWLNTQRPEWNDANNALVGNGVSMVTLFYIRRYVEFCRTLFASAEDTLTVSTEVATFLTGIADTFERHRNATAGKMDDQLRRRIVDALGQVGTTYRNRVYAGFAETTTTVQRSQLEAFFRDTLTFVDHTIAANQRPDHLYHSYNLMRVTDDGGIAIRYLYEMLEGQVAVLSAGVLEPPAVLDLLKALRNSDLYRADQHSYVLYPDRQLPRFEDKNKLPADVAKHSKLIQQLTADDDQRLVVLDVRGDYHFNGDFNNAKDVAHVLAELAADGYAELVKQETPQLLAGFEEVFDHASFTGRSGTFFGYEGLGSIYWHMVSKLLLAVQENCWSAIEQGAPQEQVDRLIEHYYDIRAGLGTHKSPTEYGAFPMDPYSHTPGNAGAQQPGMTGQVKEDILSRFGELGIVVKEGRIEFRPDLLKVEEALDGTAAYAGKDVAGRPFTMQVPTGGLLFNYCQVPILYRPAAEAGCVVHFQHGESIAVDGHRLSWEVSSQLFARTGEIVRLEVGGMLR